MSKGEAQFDALVPEPLRDGVMERVVEAGWGVSGPDPDIEIFEVQKRNVLNITFTGSIRIDGQSHHFRIESGDAAGTQILEWALDDVAPIEDYEREPDWLVPTRYRVGEFLSQGRGQGLLNLWHQDCSGNGTGGERVARIPSAKAYDAYFAPGTGTGRHHDEAARAAGYDILSQGEARAVRLELFRGTYTFGPLRNNDMAQSPRERLKAWHEALRPGTEPTVVFAEALKALAQADAVSPDGKFFAALQELGFDVMSNAQATHLRYQWFREALQITPIEGFDPASLPSDPVKELFHRLDPALCADLRVNAAAAIASLGDALCVSLARAKADPDAPIDDSWAAQARDLGFEISLAPVPAEPDDTPEP